MSSVAGMDGQQLTGSCQTGCRSVLRHCYLYSYLPPPQSSPCSSPLHLWGPCSACLCCPYQRVNSVGKQWTGDHQSHRQEALLTTPTNILDFSKFKNFRFFTWNFGKFYVNIIMWAYRDSYWDVIIAIVSTFSLISLAHFDQHLPACTQLPLSLSLSLSALTVSLRSKGATARSEPIQRGNQLLVLGGKGLAILVRRHWAAFFHDFQMHRTEKLWKQDGCAHVLHPQCLLSSISRPLLDGSHCGWKRAEVSLMSN